MPGIHKITPCLWFDDQAEDAARYYVSIFKNSRIVEIARYTDIGQEIHGKPPGSVMTVVFELDGQEFTALNGGPIFQFNEAVSFQVYCETQAEIDHFWEKLGAEGDPQARQCGWLKDKFGVSWQVVPTILSKLMNDSDPGRSQRVMQAVFQMKKLDIDQLQRAAEG
ncbi:MAG: VOC family protein [Planctomycetaceae bacterium]|nr:VOC family protein [Planctomycetaceae bacterium]